MRSYRKLAIKYHPDKNPSDKQAAEENFKIVGEAYNVLSNKETREICELLLLLECGSIIERRQQADEMA